MSTKVSPSFGRLHTTYDFPLAKPRPDRDRNSPPKFLPPKSLKLQIRGKGGREGRKGRLRTSLNLIRVGSWIGSNRGRRKKGESERATE